MKIHYEVETEHGKVIVDSENPVLHEFSSDRKDWTAPFPLVGVIPGLAYKFYARIKPGNTTGYRYCRPIAPKPKRAMNIDELADVMAKGAIFVHTNGWEEANPHVTFVDGEMKIDGFGYDSFLGYRLPHTTEILPLEVEG